MDLPRVASIRIAEPRPQYMREFGHLNQELQALATKSGFNDAFERMADLITTACKTGRFQLLQPHFGRNLFARALTWLWITDHTVRSTTLKATVVKAISRHRTKPFTMLTMLQMMEAYFVHFDKLDEAHAQGSDSPRTVIESVIMEQLDQSTLRPSAPASLKTIAEHKAELFSLGSPDWIVKRAIEFKHNLEDQFEILGLKAFASGRFADVCRQLFYLETLKSIPAGSKHSVLDELLKESVRTTPYQESRTIGHAALEIIIDRTDGTPTDTWKEFVLAMAGDPRIASTSPNFRRWWQPLGRERIERVRGWFSREDLTLFLKAVEEYGKDSANHDLQRMFPARKKFLEGLFEQDRIRSTRLLLGASAAASVRRILGRDIQTTFASMSGSNMSDKAVIYLDCGDFHLIEGSHNFKIWVYLTTPSSAIRSYDIVNFSHLDLTTKVPRDYKRENPDLPLVDITHNSQWQRRVLEFLADNGIELDIEKLFTKVDYRHFLQGGIPYVQIGRRKPQNQIQPSLTESPKVKPIPSPSNKDLTDTQVRVYNYVCAHPGRRARIIARDLGLEQRMVNQILYGGLAGLVAEKNYCWYEKSSMPG